MLNIFRTPESSMNTECLTRWNIEFNLGMLNALCIPVFPAYKMLDNLESIDMISLFKYSVHVAQGDFCLYFAEFSVYQKPKMI